MARRIDTEAHIHYIRLKRQASKPDPVPESTFSAIYVNDEDGKLWIEGGDGEAKPVGDGNVTGPVGSTDNAISRWNGDTGDVIQDSLVTINDSGSINIPFGQSYNVGGSPHTHPIADHDHTNSAGDGGSFPVENLSTESGDAGEVLKADGMGSMVWGKPFITVGEIDGDPTVENVHTIRFGANTVTDNGGGIVSVSDGYQGLTVEEVDGSPSASKVDTIIVSNGTLTDNGNGTVTLKTGSTSDDHKVLASNTDTTPSYLLSKLVGTNINIQKLGAGGDETIQLSVTPGIGTGDVTGPASSTPGALAIWADSSGKLLSQKAFPNDSTLFLNGGGTFSAPSGAGSGEKVKISLADPAAGYLENKITAGTNITITKYGTGINEYLNIAATYGGGSGPVDHGFSGCKVTWSTSSPLAVYTITKIPFNWRVYDTDGYTSTSVKDTFTIPKNGFYRVTGMAIFVTSTAGKYEFIIDTSSGGSPWGNNVVTSLWGTREYGSGTEGNYAEEKPIARIDEIGFFEEGDTVYAYYRTPFGSGETTMNVCEMAIQYLGGSDYTFDPSALNP